jgi:two-component system, OmpR family, response regulator RstA
MASEPNGTQRIMLVEDDLELASLVKERLEREGYQVSHEANGKAARDRILAEPPDLVVLDVMLPGMDGFEVCRSVRPTYREPILMLTARDEDVDEILGLEMGADDYVTKPVRPRVLLARIRNLLRRASPEPSAEGVRRIQIGDIIVDAARREVSRGGDQVDLTTVEYDLVWHLATRAGTVVSRQNLYQALFGYDYDGLDRGVDVYISRIRHKLGDDPADPELIKTVRGVGYLFAGEAS